MAPLTWRNVDAPSFSGPNEMWKLAATLMNQGFDSARRGINDFRDITTEEQSAALMQRVMAAGNDPAAIQAAAASGNPAYLSPEALKFANNQQGVLLERQATGLQNDIRGQSIRANDYNFGRTVLDNQRADANYDLLPEANAAFANLRNGIANGTLTGDAKAAAEAEFVTKYGRALGINSAADMGSFISNNQSAFTTQQNQNIEAIRNDETLTGLVRGKDAKGIAANILSRYPDYATAQRALQSWGDIDPALKVDALKALEMLAPAAVPKTPAQIEAEKNAQFLGVTPAGAQPLPGSFQQFQQGNGFSTQNPVFNGFMGTVAQGITNPYALAAVHATGIHESRFSAANANGSWSDPSQSGQPGTSGGILSWRGPRLTAMEQYGRSPEQQGAFFLNENPQLIAQLNNAKSVEEAQALMNRAWAFAGYDRPGGEAEARLNTARSVLPNYLNGTPFTNVGDASAAGPTRERARQMYQPQYQQMLDSVANNGSYTAPIDPSRVQVQNPDGTISTEKSITFKDGDNWVNIPSLVQGKQLTDEQAIAQFRDGLNPATGVYLTQKAAEGAAEARSAEIGRMLDQAANPARAQEQAQAETNQALNESMTPTIAQTTQAATPTGNDRSKEIKVNDRWTIPAVDPNASQASQDWQNSQRRSAVNGVLESIKTDLATNQGGGPLASWAGGAWDYFMADPQTARDNASAREGAGTALDWYQSETAKKYFQENPGALTEAAADPIRFQQNFGKTQTQANQTAQPTTTTNNTQTTTTTTARPAVTPPSQATASSVEMALNTALSTSAIDTANNQSLGLVDAIQSQVNSKELPAETANRLTDKDNGPLKAYTHHAVTKAIEDIMTATGANSAVAGQILQMNGVAKYNTGWTPGTDQGFLSGYEINADRAKEIWNTYVNRDKPGVEGANEGVARLMTDTLSEAQRTELATLQTQYKERETSIKALIADPTTTDADRALLRQELQNLYSFMQEKVNGIMANGRLTTNLAPRTGQ